MTYYLDKILESSKERVMSDKIANPYKNLRSKLDALEHTRAFIDKIKKIYDPEIPVNIYELGLIYKIEVDETNKVNIDMTLTSPNCPAAESLPNQVKEDIMELEEVSDVNLKLVWEPPWDKDKMSEAAKLELNI